MDRQAHPLFNRLLVLAFADEESDVEYELGQIVESLGLADELLQTGPATFDINPESVAAFLQGGAA